jgi:hypothetical protein
LGLAEKVLAASTSSTTFPLEPPERQSYYSRWGDLLQPAKLSLGTDFKHVFFSMLSFLNHLSNVSHLNNSFIILDNHALHRNSQVFRSITECKITVLFLPPSSPYFNSIEDILRLLKLLLLSCTLLRNR